MFSISALSEINSKCPKNAAWVALKLSDRAWTCDHCGIVHDRDLNAAINLEKYTASSAEI